MWDYSFFVFISGDVTTLNALDAIESNITRGSRTCLNWELSEMIAAVHQGVIKVEIKRDQNASEASDEDLMDAFSRGFITHNTWLHLSAPSTIR